MKFASFRAFYRETKAFFLCVLFYFYNLTKKNPKQKESNHPPILLIHGFLHNSSAWVWFRRQLIKQGFTNIFTINLGYPFSTMEEFASKVKDLRNDISQICDDNRLILIGHSMGGIVAAQSALDKPEGIEKIITIGSPFDGAYSACLLSMICDTQMKFHSEYMQKMYENLRFQNFPIFHIGTKNDLIVRPLESAFHTPNPTKTLQVEGEGHISMVFSQRVISEIVSFIK
ncbi:acetoin dehydrogenase E2 subunit dihydrolipoyllysine-residue acetyltransferase [Candidatus Rubidus massiliensis]|nr:acetoin dehydrogenase E2 subunit dihydrolipoyllysine-residue acetyltransferase [Candidatus Rubidus massiliensis]